MVVAGTALDRARARLEAVRQALRPLSGRRWWLHFIGRSYYGQGEFSREASRLGVSRRIAPNVLRQTHFGDHVLCAQWDGVKAVAFGFFQIETVTGLSPEARARIAERIRLTPVSEGGQVVRRKCGEYITGPAYRVEDGSDIPDLLKAAGDADLGKAMVGGQWTDLPDFHLLDLPHRQGFRRLDMRRLLDSLTVVGGAANARCAAHGQFYVLEEGGAVPGGPVQGAVGEVTGYRRRKG